VDGVGQYGQAAEMAETTATTIALVRIVFRLVCDIEAPSIAHPCWRAAAS
jgi:hypothetical protein